MKGRGVRETAHDLSPYSPCPLCCPHPSPLSFISQESSPPYEKNPFNPINPSVACKFLHRRLVFSLHPVMAEQQQTAWICALVSTGGGSGPKDSIDNDWFFPDNMFQSIMICLEWKANQWWFKHLRFGDFFLTQEVQVHGGRHWQRSSRISGLKCPLCMALPFGLKVVLQAQPSSLHFRQ